MSPAFAGGITDLGFRWGSYTVGVLLQYNFIVARSCIQVMSRLFGDGTHGGLDGPGRKPLLTSGGVVRWSSQRRTSEWPSAKENPTLPTVDATRPIAAERKLWGSASRRDPSH